jgi:hypothetical protein
MPRRGKNLVSLLAAVILAGLMPALGARAAVPDEAGAPAGICDPIDGAKCLLPFPNDYFTTPDPSTDTGIRVDFNPLVMPQNVEGKPIDPTEWNRNDGFSPGSVMITYVPGLDLDATGAPPITDIERSLDADSPIVLLNAETGERHPFWAELDSHAEAGEQPLLLIHPAVNLTEGDTYIVALRNLKDQAGAAIAPNDAFLAYRQGTATDDRQQHFNEIFSTLETAGVARDSLYLAWDYTVGSEDNQAERMLHIRDDAFENYLGDHSPGALEADGTPGGAAPKFTVKKVENNVNSRIARRVTGSFTVPNYLAGGNACFDPSSSDLNCTGGVHNRFNYVGATNEDGDLCTIVDPGCLPAQNPVVPELETNFTCIIPRAALSDGAATNAQVHPARASLYGHGLLGGASEANQGQLQDFANEHDVVFCATDWIGMATEDVPNVASILADMSNFPTLADRSQQGMLNFLFLGRLLIHPDGFVSDKAFAATLPKGAKGAPASTLQPVIDTSALYYDGNSQGGIMGGALTAVAQDFTHATIGVTGMNYSILLDRSVDFATYYAVFSPNYPDRIDQEIIYALMQMLWDRAEANGYALHMTTDPYPKTPAHEVIMHVGYGDHQVANVTAEIEARSIGAYVYEPSLMPGRSPDVDPHWGLPSVCTPTATLACDASFPFHGSVIVFWDNCLDFDPATCQTPPPPITNMPPDQGEDPHEFPRRQAAARLQKSTFFQPNGYVIDVCGGKPCLSPTP